MAPEDAEREFQKGFSDNKNMDETEFTASNFMPKDLIEIIYFLKRCKSGVLIKLHKRLFYSRH